MTKKAKRPPLTSTSVMAAYDPTSPNFKAAFCLAEGAVSKVLFASLPCAHFCHSKAESRRISPSKGRLVSMRDSSASNLRMTETGKQDLNNDFDIPSTEVGLRTLLG